MCFRFDFWTDDISLADRTLKFITVMTENEKLGIVSDIQWFSFVAQAGSYGASTGNCVLRNMHERVELLMVAETKDRAVWK